MTAQPAPPRSRGYIARTVIWILVAQFASMLNLVHSPLGHRGAPEFVLPGAVVTALALPIFLIWRRRLPLLVTLVAAVIGCLAPVGAMTAWIALGSAVRRRRGAVVWWLAAAVTVTTMAAVVRDVMLSPRESMLASFVYSPETAPDLDSWLPELGWYVVPSVALAMTAVVVGVGLLLRLRGQAQQAATHVVQARARTDALGSELARQQERQRIAQEVHDGIGQRLSVVALHAGALTVSRGLSPDVSERADLVRQSAAEAADDLRVLVRVLRQDEELPPVPLTQLQNFVNTTAESGLAVTASIQIAHADAAPVAVARAVVRTVQELLTNARKHAGGELLTLTVSGGPASGIRVHGHNLRPQQVQSAGIPSGYGLQGISERVEHLGGTVRAGPDASGTSFSVEVHVPWEPRHVGAPS